MKLNRSLLILGSLCLMQNSATALAKSEVRDVPLGEVFSSFNVSDFTHPKIETLTVNEPGGCSPFYYVEISFPGSLGGEPYQVELDFQTLNPENMNRIAAAIAANYSVHGLPECMKNDLFSIDSWTSNELKKIIMVPASFKKAPGSCYAMALPFTECVNVANLYP